jgi:hypothetical protein
MDLGEGGDATQPFGGLNMWRDGSEIPSRDVDIDETWPVAMEPSSKGRHYRVDSLLGVLFAPLSSNGSSEPNTLCSSYSGQLLSAVS